MQNQYARTGAGLARVIAALVIAFALVYAGMGGATPAQAMQGEGRVVRVDKEARYDPVWGQVYYRITVKNVGSKPYLDTGAPNEVLHVFDDLSGILAHADLDLNSLGTAINMTEIRPFQKAVFHPEAKTITWDGGLLVGETLIITYRVNATSTGMLTNMAVAAGSDEGGPTPAECVDAVVDGQPITRDPVTLRACAGTGTLVPSYSLEKSASPSGPVAAGQTVTYTVTARNEGSSNNSPTITDNLTGVADDATIGTPTTANGTATLSDDGTSIEWTPTLTPVGTPGSTATLTYTATVKGTANQGDGQLRNFASGSGVTNCPAQKPDDKVDLTWDNSPAPCRTSTAVGAPSSLQIAKSASPASGLSVSPGDTVTYSVTVKNPGTAAVSNAAIKDDLADVLDDAGAPTQLSATIGGTAAAAPVFDGSRYVTWNGSIPGGATLTLSYRVQVKDPMPATGANWTLHNLVTNATSGVTSNCDAGSSNAGCSTSHQVGSSFTVKKEIASQSATPLVAGSSITYRITGTNASGSLTDRSISDDLTALARIATIDTSSITSTCGGTSTCSAPAGYDSTAHKLTWDGKLGSAGTVTITFTAQILPRAQWPSGVNSLPANTVTAPGSNCATPGDAACTTPGQPIQSVVIAKSVARGDGGTMADPVTTGSVLTYTVKITNDGSAAIANGTVIDDLADVLDQADLTANATVTGGGSVTPTPSGGKLTWTGSLAAGASATITYSVTAKERVTAGMTDRIANTVSTALAGSNCPAGATDARCHTSTPTSALHITKSVTPAGAAAPGATVAYQVQVTNSGASAYPTATFTDDLTGVLDDATLVGSPTVTSTAGARPASEATVSGSALTWTGPLAAGETVTVHYSAKVKDASQLSSGAQLTNKVTSTTAGANCSATSTDPDCATSTPIAAVTLAKSVSATSVAAGGKVTYTITARNAGSADATGVAISDDLTGVVDDAAVSGATATLGLAPIVSGSALTWNGTIPKGQTLTITYVATVKTPGSAFGDKVLRNVVSGGENCPAAAACRTTTQIRMLSLTKTSDSGGKPVQAGRKLTYTLLVSNTGTSDYVDAAPATVTDDLSGVLGHARLDTASLGAELTDATGSVGKLTSAGTSLTWSGPLAAGKTVRITFSVTVESPLADGVTLRNQATATDSQCTGQALDPATCRTVDATGKLNTTKTVLPAGPVSPGQVVTYTITTSNPGSAAMATTIDDSLADVLDDASLISAPALAAGSPGDVTWDPATKKLHWAGTVASGGSAQITYRVTVADPTKLSPAGNRVLRNTVVEPVACPAQGAPALCSTSSPVQSLTLTKTASPASGAAVAVGGTITYTVTAKNTGATDLTDASLTDLAGGVLDDATVSSPFAQVGASTWQVDTAGTPGSYTAHGPLAVGDSVTFQYQATVTGNGDLSIDNRVQGGASSNCPAATSSDSRCSTHHSLIPVFTLAKTAGPSAAPLRAGSTVTYTITGTGSKTGTGQIDRTITDDVSKLLTIATIDPASLTATCTDAATCATPPTLDTGTGTISWSGKVGDGRVTISFTAHVNDRSLWPAGMTSLPANTATAAGSNCDPAGGATLPATCTAQAMPLQSLTIAKTVARADGAPQSDPLVAGDALRYRISVTNTGGAPVDGASITDDVTSVLAQATISDVAVAGPGSVSGPTGNTIGWTGDLPKDGTATITYTATLKAGVTPSTIVNRVTSPTPGSNCPAGAGDPACATSTPASGLQIATQVTSPLTAPATPGGKVTYRTQITNTGATAYADAAWSADLAGALTNATWNDDAAISSSAGSGHGGTAAFAGSALTWHGPLAPGETVTVTYSVTVRPIDKLTAGQPITTTVTSATKGANCAASSIEAACRTATDIRAVAVSKQADKSSLAPGGTLTYTVTAVNRGSIDATAVRLTDTLAGVLDDAARVGDVTVSPAGGTLGKDPGVIDWQGTIPTGGTLTLTYQVKAFGPDGAFGDHMLRNSVVGGDTCPGSAPCTTATPIRLLDVRKTSDATGPVVAGQVVTYSVAITNTGAFDYTAADPASISDSIARLLSAADYVPGSAKAEPAIGQAAYDLDAATVTWRGPLAAGRSVIVTFQVKAKAPLPDGATFVNDVAAPDSVCAASNPPAQCSASNTTVKLVTSATSSAPGPVVPGQTVTYTVMIRNQGSGAGSTTVDDSLAGILDDATLVADPVLDPHSPGSLTYDKDSKKARWTGDLAAGGTASFTFQVMVADPTTLTPRGDGVLRNAAVEPSSCPATGAPASCSSSNPVRSLTLTKTADPKPGTPVPLGGKITYKVTATNTGAVPLTGASFTDQLTGVIDDAPLTAAPATVAGEDGKIDYVSGADSFTWTGDLPVNAATTVGYTATVADKGDLAIDNAITSSDRAANCRAGVTDARCTTHHGIVPAFDVSEAATDSATPLVAGSTVTYTITGVSRLTLGTPVERTITQDLSKVAKIAAIDPASVTATCTPDVGVTGDCGTASLDPATGLLTWTGSLPDATVTVTFTANVAPRSEWPAAMNATIPAVSLTATGSACDGSDQAPAGCGVPAKPLQSLQIVKDFQRADGKAKGANLVAGDQLDYTVTVTNTGATTLAAGTVTDDMSKVLAKAELVGKPSADIGDATVSGPTLTWTLAAPARLAPGAAVTITYSVRVTSGVAATDSARIINVVASAIPGNDCPAGAANQACTTTSPTSALDVRAAVVSPSGGHAGVGEKVTYSITITNTGDQPYRAADPYVAAQVTANLADVLDDATWNDDATATIGEATATAPTLAGTELTWSGDLDPGKSAVLTYSVTIKAADKLSADALLRQQVTSTSPGASCVLGTETGCGTSTQVDAVIVTKQVDKTVAEPGEKVTYMITARNVGSRDWAGLTLSDDVAGVVDDTSQPAELTRAPAGGKFTGDDTHVVWTGDLAAHQDVTLTYRVTVHGYGQGTGDQLLTGAVTGGSTCPADKPCAAADVQVKELAVTLVSSADGSTVRAGDPVTYRIEVRNIGTFPFDDATRASVRQDLAGVLEHATPVGDPAVTELADKTAARMARLADGDTAGAEAGAEDGAKDGAGGPELGTAKLDAETKALTWSGPLAAGAAVRIEQTVTLNTPPGDGVWLDSRVRGESSNCQDQDPALDACVTRDATAAFAITKTSDAPANPDGGVVVVPGQLVTYTITDTNNGTGPAEHSFSDSLANVLDDAEMVTEPAVSGGSPSGAAPAGDAAPSDDAPSGAAPSDAAPSDDATPSAGTVSWDKDSGQLGWSGTLQPGQTIKVSYQVRVLDPTTTKGDRTLVNEVVTTDYVCPAQGAPGSCGSTLPVRSLTITKTADPASGGVVQLGATVHYTIRIENTGAVDLSGATVSDDRSAVADDATFGAAVTTGPGAVTAGDGGATLTWTGDLPADTSAIVEYDATITGKGDTGLTNTVTSADPGSNCPAGSGDERCSTHHTTPGLAIETTATVDGEVAKPGSLVTYEVTATNTGKGRLIGATWSDDISGVLDDAAITGKPAADAGEATFPDGGTAVGWTGDLEPGASATVTFQATVARPVPGDYELTSKVTAGTPGSNCGADSHDPACSTSDPIAALAIEKKTSADSVQVGDIVRYTLTVHNLGTATYPAAALTDDLADVLDDASVVGSAAATGGLVSLDGATLTWAGDVPAGETATITYAVRAKPAAQLGDKVMANTVLSSDDTTCPAEHREAQCSTLTKVTVPEVPQVIAQVIPKTIAKVVVPMLPYTGATIGAAAGLALAALALGVVLLCVRRRRAEQ